MNKILLAFFYFVCITALAQNNKQQITYVCLPCGSTCDNAEHKQPGQCEHCQMELVDKSTVVHKNIEPETICKFISENKNVVLLDVRTREEYEGTADPNFGTLKNAINIPIQELEQRLRELDKYKNSTILVFCSHSRRSPRASYLLTQNGFKKVVNMNGGMSVVTDESCKK